MDLEDQWLTREQVIAQRDVHRKAADEWLSRMALASLTGNGAALITIANSKVIADGALLVRLASLVVAVIFLAGVLLSFTVIAAQRAHHSDRSMYFSKRAGRSDFDEHFAPSISAEDAAKFRAGLERGLSSTEASAQRHADAANLSLIQSIAVSAFGLLALVAILFFAPKAPLPPPPEPAIVFHQYR